MRWQIELTSEAQNNYLWLCEHLGKAVAEQVEEELIALAKSRDPRQHCHVKPMATGGQCPGWYRLAIYTPVPLRIIFSLHEQRGDQWIEVHELDNLNEGVKHKVATERLGLRGWVYNDGLTGLWRKRHGK